MRRSSPLHLSLIALLALISVGPARALAPLFPPGSDAAPARGEDFHPTLLRHIPDNAHAWYARWWALDAATENLDITYFEFHVDVFGKALLGKVLEKARQGIQIRLMIDSRGSLKLATRFASQAYLRELARYPNVQIKIYKPLTGTLLKIPRTLRALIASNHDKILLVDGALAIVGGRNLGEHYFAAHEDLDTALRDHDLMLQGPEIGAEVQRAFESEFDSLLNLDISRLRFGDRERIVRELDLARDEMDRWIRGLAQGDPGEVPRRDRKMLRALQDELAVHPGLREYQDFVAAPWAGSDTLPVRILDKGSVLSPENDITENLLHLLANAEHEIIIQSAYLVLTDRVLAALRSASARGVQILVVTNSPKSKGNILTQAFFVRDWKAMMAAVPSMRLFMTTTRRLHAKVFVVDRRISCIGSYNVDPMSESINSELMAMVDSPTLAAQVGQTIRDSLDEATECRIEVRGDGEVIGLVGPDDHLRGMAGLVIRLLGRLRFLRPLV